MQEKKKRKARKPSTGSKRTPSSKASTSSTASNWKWIRINRPFPLPFYVREAIQRLDEAGHVAYVVGGSVRDFLLSREVKDHDIATDAGPDELCRLFPDAVTVGKAFGVLKIPLARFAPEATGKLPEFLEIATFREDLEYKDHRHPEAVRFSGPLEDASRRDFTVNALFFDPKSSRVLDSTGGMDDLRAKVIRAIGDPRERFREDALRLLRAVRFTTTLGFTLDPATAAAIRDRAPLIQQVSDERIRDELTLMWKGPSPAAALEMLSDLGLLKHVLPEVQAMREAKQPWHHTLRTLRILSQKTPARSVSLAWAAVLHDAAKAVGREMEGGAMGLAIAERMRMSRTDAERIAAIVQDHAKFRDVYKMREATLERFVREPYIDELLALHQADALASDGNLAFYEFCASRLEQVRKAPVNAKLIDGKDLIQLGLQPGPRFSEILGIVEDLALERKLSSKEQALEYVIQHFAK